MAETEGGKCLYAMVRIPKSGSSSMSLIVREALPDAARFELPHSYYGDWQLGVVDRIRFLRQQKKTLARHHGTLSLESAIRRIDRESRDGDIVLGGHISLRDFRRLDAELRPITLFREPASRLISEYNYNRSQIRKRRTVFGQLDSAFSKKAATRLDLDAYVSLMLEHKAQIGNVACQLLDIQTEDQIPGRLDELFHFGILEKMEDFVERLGRKTGRDLTPVRRNVTSDRAVDSISRETLAKVETLNALDFELYEQARARLSAPSAA